MAGEFNAWQVGALQMHREANTNNWSASIQVGQNLQGRRVQFKFVENGTNWCACHSLPKVDDGHGNENNYFQLGESRVAFDTQH